MFSVSNFPYFSIVLNIINFQVLKILIRWIGRKFNYLEPLVRDHVYLSLQTIMAYNLTEWNREWDYTVLMWSGPDAYVRCMHEPENLSRCAGCKVVWYCSTECQRTAWKAGHKLECPIYQRLPGILPTEVRPIHCFTYHTVNGTNIPRFEAL